MRSGKAILFPISLASKHGAGDGQVGLFKCFGRHIFDMNAVMSSVCFFQGDVAWIAFLMMSTQQSFVALPPFARRDLKHFKHHAVLTKLSAEKSKTHATFTFRYEVIRRVQNIVKKASLKFCGHTTAGAKRDLKNSA